MGKTKQRATFNIKMHFQMQFLHFLTPKMHTIFGNVCLLSLMHVIDRAMGIEKNHQHHQNIHFIIFLF